MQLHLVDELGLYAYSTEVIKLEWGVNIYLPQDISVRRLISNILVYKGKSPSRHVYEGDGMMFLIDLNEFSIKIYNKSAQHQNHEHDNVMRYELRIERKSLLNRMGIYSVHDLFDKKKISALQDKLLETTEHLLFFDYDIKSENIPTRSKTLLFEYNNSGAWEKLMQNKPELYRKKKKSFALQVTKASGIDWNKLVHEAVDLEAKKLLIGKPQDETLQV